MQSGSKRVMTNSFNAVRIPTDSEIVEDADEEVFILYCGLQKQTFNDPQKHRGLGFVDPRQNILTVTIELNGGDIPTENPESKPNFEKKRTRTRVKPLSQHIDDKSIEVNLAQDITALRTRKGDTGSVLWHASVDFARFVLQQAHMKSQESLFDFEQLKDRHIFELGAGTGILGLLLSPLCRRYTATDIPELIPLIQKNVAINFPVHSSIYVQPFDWVVLKNTLQHRRRTLFPVEDPIDILLIVDSIYHPSLLPPLVETIDYLSTPGQTAVIIVSELRSEDVIREFLELWLSIPGWAIRRHSNAGFCGPYVMWIGWKTSTDIITS